jgi:hypothetical protein
VTKPNSVGFSRSHDPDIAAQAPTCEPIHACVS